MIQSRPFSKYLFSLLIFVLTISPSFIPKNANASHIMGGEITAAHLGNYAYELNLVLYRDIQGIPNPNSHSFTISNAGGTIATVMAFLDSSFLDTMTIGGNVVGFEASYYKSTAYTFPISGTYFISWNSCCRNAAILNCQNPGSQSIHLETMLTIPVLPNVNSTPVYLAAPVVYVQIDSLLQHNPMPFDVDGDSLVWSIDSPWSNASTIIPGYITPSAHPGGTFTIDQLTGEINWTPNMLGNFIATVMVEEYRAGTNIGQIRRDMQFIVVNDTSLTSPRIGNFNTLPTDANGNAKIILPPGIPYNVTLNASDAQNNNILFTSYEERYMMNSNPASFVSNAPVPGQATGTFSWTPNLSQARVNPYLVSFRVSDGLMAYDETLIIEVGNFTSSPNNESSTVGNSYPNPTQNIFFVPFELKSSADVRFELFDIIGNKVANDVIKTYNSGIHKERFNMELPAGIYFIKISVDNKVISSKKITIQ